MRILVTGGAGFIGSNFIRYILKKYSDYSIINLDKLTYAGNLDNLKDVKKDPRYKFVKGDICDAEIVEKLVTEADAVVNFAAETHVDRSIGKPDDFIKTDIFGVYTLLEAVKKKNIRLLQVSTDEVYGSIEKGEFKEPDRLNPSSPYSSSKAGAELLAHSYFVTFGTDIVVTRSSNNFGPYQYPEKLIPLFITNAIEGKKLPIYGDGKQVRDWIYVDDNCEALDLVLHKGKGGEAYNVGGGNERTNMYITKKILELLNKTDELINYVQDRPGHDRRYAVECKKISALGWKPMHGFDEAMKKTVEWYKNNAWWWQKIKSGEYLKYYKEHYEGRHKLK
jgi:dTDP-glucose 4,6-dehydratase